MGAPAKTGIDRVPALVRSVLWIDCSGGLVVGVLMLVFSDSLQRLFQFPSSPYFAMAAANVFYGSYSLVLALLKTRSVRLVSALALANAAWGGVCLVAVACMFNRASIFGIMHLLAECALVCWLARYEWRHRALIAANGFAVPGSVTPSC